MFEQERTEVLPIPNKMYRRKAMQQLISLFSVLCIFAPCFGQSEFITIWKTDNSSGANINTSTTQIKLPFYETSYAGKWEKVGEPTVKGTFSKATLSGNVLDFNEIHST